MVGRVGKHTNRLDDIFEQKIQTAQQQTWGEIPGEIVDFDPQKQTATVQPKNKPRVNGKVLDMPVLYEVPVRMTRAGKGGITFPIAKGDKVTLRPQKQNTEKFHDEDDGSPEDGRTFSLADMEAHLDGGESLKDPVKNFDNANTHIRFDEEGNFGLRGSKEGKVKLEGSEGNIYDLIATFMELVASDQLLITHGSSSGTGHQLFNRDALIEIAGKIRAMAL